MIVIKSGFRSVRVIAARTEEVGAFQGLEDVDELANKAPQAIHGSLGCFSEHGLEAGKGFQDRVEVGAVGRKEVQRCACRLDPWRTAGRVWLDRLSMMTTSPGLRA
ncbi:hypothetical protein [Sphingobium sp. SA916]|uniref:hypothetical protein n=1 Tax=Sphingobium sp. SA916 TaxID=1851207 RepID=UPI000CA7B095|nr:hypothetical protein [Sphingobium sp. SA916]PNQ03961.1 hypothetical protein A8G00_08700 [Sphingobium sp. SA916]